MIVRSRLLAFGYRAVAALVIVVGIARVSGLWTASPTWTSFLYYTVLSNVLCLAWMILSAVVTLRDAQREGWTGASTPSARWAAAVMEAITVTMLIYLFVLAPSLFTQPGAYQPFTLTDNLVHIITPVLVIVDWLLFVPKGRLRGYDPLLWALIPYAYLVFAFGYSALGGRFAGGTTVPYPFMDVSTHGVGGVAVWIVGLTVALVAVGYLFLGLDRLLARVGPAAETEPAR
ncbi:Pr6Pr family membrane protein [Microbacterium hominis]|uniref:Pr6Pr family membrane protein n=1 Tax=Microbacterium TaxID=33882 RepID=UPI00168AA850|nr:MULTISPECIES: Pr6Pr family membrane protein [Microbacterium]QOC24448.1 Pr6Pr family membrane protein [Microbacterium hominis]QOC28524.1 Pr6Pr family membrane protein [Microbacterium hominis]QYF96271.1 Pr6Pr family membrane protein [Microbacterium sp. PAMC21962]